MSFFKRQPEAIDRQPHRPVRQPHRVLTRQPGLQRRQGDVRMGRDMRRQGGLLRRRQLARPVTAPRAGAHLPGPPPPDHGLVDVRHADPKHARRRPRRQATIDRRQNPRPQLLRIALSLPPNHRCPQHLAVREANHTLPCAGIPFSDSSQYGYALGSAFLCADLGVTAEPRDDHFVLSRILARRAEERQPRHLHRRCPRPARRRLSAWLAATAGDDRGRRIGGLLLLAVRTGRGSCRHSRSEAGLLSGLSNSRRPA